MIFKRHSIDVSGRPKPIVGLPKGVLKYRCRFRINSVPTIVMRFQGRISRHLLLCNGDNLEPYVTPEAVNVI
jgi:hypothetical protein